MADQFNQFRYSTSTPDYITNIINQIDLLRNSMWTQNQELRLLILELMEKANGKKSKNRTT
jgi:hypothetical protein